MIQIIGGIRNSVANSEPAQPSLADADPAALVAGVACIVLMLACVVIYVVSERNH